MNRSGVYIVNFTKNETGMILYEHLLTLSIIICVLPLIIFILQFIQQDNSLDDLAVDHFFLFIRNDLWYSETVAIKDHKLFITNDHGDIATIELYNNRIRRQLKGGNEFYLFDVAKMEVDALAYGVHIKITTKKGNEYEKVISQHPK